MKAINFSELRSKPKTVLDIVAYTVALTLLAFFIPTAIGQVTETSVIGQTEASTIQTQNIAKVNHRFEYTSGFGAGSQYGFLGYQGALVNDYIRFRLTVLAVPTFGVDYNFVDNFSIGFTIINTAEDTLDHSFSLTYAAKDRFKGFSFGIEYLALTATDDDDQSDCYSHGCDDVHTAPNVLFFSIGYNF